MPRIVAGATNFHNHDSPSGVLAMDAIKALIWDRKMKRTMKPRYPAVAVK
jgi:hypothetical protein